MGDHSIPKGQPQRLEKARLCTAEVRARDMEEVLLSRAELAGTPNANERATKISKVGRV